MFLREVRGWSLTQLSLTSAAAWVAALTYVGVADALGVLTTMVSVVPIIVLSYAPGFFIARWSSEREHVVGWPIGRVIVTWLLMSIGWFVFADFVGDLAEILAGAFFAPALILSWNWYEGRRCVRRDVSQGVSSQP